MSRAERFEDEKRRIIESCFSKLDQNGQLAESYITHIRIQEDGAHPSTPPPPDSAQDTKKPRLIIIAVRSTGRVRMHKARENNNGSFSIGKTWNLEELSAIESFSGNLPPPQSEKEAQYRSWAGNVGFTVTITKPYYWQAGTAKEKEFFIASAVKIYRKYTKGQVPELRGFDENAKASMLGAMPGQPPPSQGPPQLGTQAPPDVSQPPDTREPPNPPQPPFAKRPQSREDSRYRGSPGPPGSMSDRDPRNGSGPPSRQPSESPASFIRQPVPRPFASSEQLRSQSREGYRQDSRPGTSSGPGGYRRSPAPPPLGTRAPSQQSSHSQLRSESPANFSTSSSSGRDQQRVLAPPPSSPGRRPSYEHTIDAVSDDRSVPRSPPPNGVSAAGLFQSTRERWQQQSQLPSQTQTAQLPPIETGPSAKPNGVPKQPATRKESTPTTAGTVSTSPGVGDATAFASITGFMGPEFTPAGPPPPTVNEPSSPPTPERSKKRPPIENTQSDSTLDMRPAPLNQRTKASEGSGTQATPKEPPAGSVVDTLNLPEARPAAPAKTLSDSNLEKTGALERFLDASALSSERPATADDQAKELDEDYRPGLGPMLKKKVVADRFKKAATAANAFKPRAGGAAERILQAKAQREVKDEPDGITGVVPARKKEQTQSEPVSKQLDDLAVKAPSIQAPPMTPTVEVSSPLSPPADPLKRELGGMDGTQGVELHDESPRLQTPNQEQREIELAAEDEISMTDQRQVRQPQIKVKRRSAQQEQYLTELGIDRSLLADKCLDFEMMLNDFGWKDAALSPKALADMEADLRREQSRLEAGAWLSSPSQEASVHEDRGKQVLNLLDRAIQECDEMDGLLTIYNVELSSLNEDIAYIEAQSQGLQVQAANQRLLHTELRNLVDTISLDKRSLEPLRHADLSALRGIDDAEQAIIKLYQALITIDPSIRTTPSGRPKSRGGMNEGSELSSMAAVRQKRDVYGQESDRFCQRFMQTLDFAFTAAFNKVKGQALLPAGGSSGAMKLNPDAFTEARRGLWVYSPLILFAKELNQPAWQTSLRMYHTRARPLYAESFGQNVAGWKRALRKPTGEEADVLFTAQDREEPASGSALSSARKLTVKRSQTLAKTLRTASGEKHSSPSESRNSGALSYCEVFSGAMDEMAPLVSQEQNFVVELFHATSLESADFLDVVSATPPSERYGTSLLERKPLDPDREMARRVTSVMDEIFGFFTAELSSLLDWTISADPIQGVGVMACLSKHSFYLQDSSQEFLVQLAESLMARLQSLFAKFVDEQVRAIEDTKVKIKKRKGVIGFMKTFPAFSAAVENTLASIGGADYEQDAESMYEVRKRVDEAYARINRAMFDSLKVIAKESPGAAPQTAKTATDDPEDKEIHNYNVLIIENMNHYIEEVDDGGKQGVLAEWKGRALMDRAEAMDNYVGQVIRRPLGKLLVRRSLLSDTYTS